MRMLSFALAALAAAGGVQAAPALPDPPAFDAAALQAWLPALRKGGYTIYLRHAATRLDQQDRQPVVLADCSTQRNLSDDGRRQARALGEAFRRLRIPVERVLSSPFCRSMDTARLAFDRAQASADLHFAVGLPKAEREAKGEALRRLLAQPTGRGRNTVIVAHTANLEEAVGLWPKPEGAAIVFRADAAGRLQAVARIAPEVWAGLAGP